MEGMDGMERALTTMIICKAHPPIEGEHEFEVNPQAVYNLQAPLAHLVGLQQQLCLE